MIFIRCLSGDLRRAILSPRFCIAVFGYGLLLCLNLPVDPWPKDPAYLFSVSYKFGFYIFFYLCAAIPYATAFLSDIDHNYLQAILKRTSVRTYSVSKCVAVMLSGMLAVTLATAIFLVYLFVCFSSEEVIPQSYSGWDRLISDGKPVLYFIVKAGMTAMIGGLFSVIALNVSTVIRNSFVVLAAPVLLYYAWNELATLLSLPTALDIGALLYVPVFENSMTGSILYLTAITVIGLLLMTSLFEIHIRRLRRNGCCA